MELSFPHLEQIDEVYQDYLNSTLPKGGRRILILAGAWGIMLGIPLFLHRILSHPVGRFEGYLLFYSVQGLAAVTLVVMLWPMGWGKYGEQKPTIRQIAAADQKFISTLMTFPDDEMKYHLGTRKEEWALNDKEAEALMPASIAFAAILTTITNWTHQSKIGVVTILVLISITVFTLAMQRKRQVRLRRFEFLVNQALAQKTLIIPSMPSLEAVGSIP